MRVEGSRYRVQGSRYRVQVVGFGVKGYSARVHQVLLEFRNEG